MLAAAIVLYFDEGFGWLLLVRARARTGPGDDRVRGRAEGGWRSPTTSSHTEALPIALGVFGVVAAEPTGGAAGADLARPHRRRPHARLRPQVPDRVQATRTCSGSDGAAARPLDDLAVRRRRAGAVLLRAQRASGGSRGGAPARGARRRRSAALRVRDGRDDRDRARAALARLDGRARAGTPTTAPASCSPSSSAGGSGTCSSTRPARRRPDADLVWIEAPSNPLLTMPDFEAAAAHPGPRRLRRDRGDARAPARARARLRPRPPLGRRSTSPATTTCCSARSSPSGRARRPPARARTRTGIVAAPDAAWLLLRGLKTLEIRVRARPRPRRSSPPASARTRRCTSCAIPASAACSRSTSPTASAARRVETSTRLIVNATSLGGVTSTIETRHRWEGDRVPPGCSGSRSGLEPADEPLARPRARARKSVTTTDFTLGRPLNIAREWA